MILYSVMCILLDLFITLFINYALFVSVAFHWIIVGPVKNTALNYVVFCYIIEAIHFSFHFLLLLFFIIVVFFLCSVGRCHCY